MLGTPGLMPLSILIHISAMDQTRKATSILHSSTLPQAEAGCLGKDVTIRETAIFSGDLVEELSPLQAIVLQVPTSLTRVWVTLDNIPLQVPRLPGT